MKSAITVCWGPRPIPAIIYDNLEHGLARARALGFDGIEINGPLNELNQDKLVQLVANSGLEIAAVMTGTVSANGVCLSSAEEKLQKQAFEGIGGAIDLARASKAIVSIGKVMGPSVGDRELDAIARRRAIEQIRLLARRASGQGVRLAVEPMNRYLNPLICTVGQAMALVDEVGESNVGLMLDVFHMNMEEASMDQAIWNAGNRVFYVQLADSNRHAPGFGHLDFEPVIQGLRAINYDGWISAEVLPLPDPDTAAAKWHEAYERFWGKRPQFTLGQAEALRRLLNADPVFEERSRHFLGSVALMMGKEAWVFWFNGGQVVRVQSGIPPEGVDFSINGPPEEWATVFKGEKHLLHALNPYLGRLRLSGNVTRYAANVRPIFYLVSQLQKVTSYV